MIEGASQGKGLGIQFLKHIERARVLVILIDLAPVDGVSPEEQEAKLLKELGEYMSELLERPRLVVGSKSDVAQFDFDGMKISAVTRSGIETFLGSLGDLIEQARQDYVAPESYIVHSPKPEGYKISREDDGGFRVEGRSIERVVAMSDLNNEDALDYVHQKLTRMGLEKAMKKYGISQGDIVRIGEMEFEFEDEEAF